MSDFQKPGAKQVVPVRPLTKGMFRDRSGQHIEDGGFHTVRNAIVAPEGIKRRPSFYTIAVGDDGTPDTFSDNAVGSKSWIQTNGNTTEILFTESSVYNMSKNNGLTLIPFSYTTGTVSTADGLTITGSTSPDTAWSSATDWDNVQAGDYFKIDSNSDVVKISEVTDKNTIVLASAYAVTSFTDVDYTIYRGFRLQGTKYLVDTVVANDRMVFLSRHLPPVELDATGVNLEPLQASGGDSTINSAHFSAVAGAFFNERLYLGHITELVDGAYEEYRQRIRFSTVTDFGNFTDTNYIDLTYSGGSIKAIKPMGNLLAVYLEDAVYLAQSTPDVNNPLIFDQVETGGVGLVGQKAVVGYLDGHFLVGQDNIYFHSTRGFEAIGTPVLSETIRKCDRKWRIYAVADPKRSRICFGFPRASNQIEFVWSFHYLTGAWSYEDYSTYMIAAPKFDDSLTWDDLAGTWDAIDSYGPTWDDIRVESDAQTDLIRERDGVIQLASNGYTVDDIDGAIILQLESKDHDLDRPDLEKCWTRLAIKLRFLEEAAFDEALDFTVEVSQNRGRSWKNVGTLRVRAGMDEGHCDFRLTSSTFRFRLTSAAEVVPYTITEYTFSVTPFANESHLGSQEGN